MTSVEFEIDVFLSDRPSASSLWLAESVNKYINRNNNREISNDIAPEYFTMMNKQFFESMLIGRPKQPIRQRGV